MLKSPWWNGWIFSEQKHWTTFQKKICANVCMILTVTSNKRDKMRERGRERVRGREREAEDLRRLTRERERKVEWHWCCLTHSLSPPPFSGAHLHLLSFSLTGPDCSIVYFNLLVRPAVARLESQRATNYKNIFELELFLYWSGWCDNCWIF